MVTARLSGEPEEARGGGGGGGGGCNVHMCIVPKREDERVEDERKSRRSPRMSPLSIIQITAWY